MTKLHEAGCDERIDISNVISTFNRSGILAKALSALLNQKTGGVRYEVIVVDNNSTDIVSFTESAFPP